MRAGQLPVDEQLAHLRAVLHENPTLIEVLARTATMDLPGWYLVAGCVYQTVWNVVTSQPAEAGILDYDLAYFDDSDLSWEAEYRAGRYTGEQPVTFTNDILTAARHAGITHGLYIGCGNGRNYLPLAACLYGLAAWCGCARSVRSNATSGKVVPSVPISAPRVVSKTGLSAAHARGCLSA